MVGALVSGYRCAMSCCDLDLTFDLVLVTLSLKILSELYLKNLKCRILILRRDIALGM